MINEAVKGACRFAELTELGFRSLYHHTSREEHGQEGQPTFYQHRSEAKPYHIDYVFAHETQLAGGMMAVQIGAPSEWLQVSDHILKRSKESHKGKDK